MFELVTVVCFPGLVVFPLHVSCKHKMIMIMIIGNLKSLQPTWEANTHYFHSDNHDTPNYAVLIWV